MDDASDELQKAAIDFLVALRLAEGFNDAHFERLKRSLRAFHARWASSSTIPKSSVLTLIDLPRMVEACAPLYAAEPVKQRIVDASAELVDVILEGF